MTRHTDVDHTLESWLAEGPSQLPDHVVDGIVRQLDQTNQRRRIWPPGRTRMNRMVLAIGGMAAVLVLTLVGAGLLLSLNSNAPSLGGEPSPTVAQSRATQPPTASPSANPDATTASSEAGVTELLNDFLAARVAGEGAQQYLGVPEDDIPLLYATTSGTPYERGEFESVHGIEWPYGFIAYKVRLFAGDTVVEQLFFAPDNDPERFPADGRQVLEYEPDGFATDIAPTTEDGQPVALPYTYFDGEVSVHAAHPWVFADYVANGLPGGRLIPEGAGIQPTTDGGQRNDWDQLVLMTDPAPSGTDCQTGPTPADAEALAQSIRSDPGLDATTPVAVSVGGNEGLMIDVTVAAGASICSRVTGTGDFGEHPGVLSLVFDLTPGSIGAGDDVVTGHATGEWLRLYLLDAPEGSSIGVLAIAIVAPQSRFERAVEAAAPVVSSIEFQAQPADE